MRINTLAGFFLLSLLLFSCKNVENSSSDILNSAAPKFTPIQKANGPIRLDGGQHEEDWRNAEWHNLDHVWLGGELDKDDFSGRFKLLWSVDKLYILVETKDDKVIDTHEDGLDRYWDDDCLELFIDENNSDGDHQYTYNAFAYHIATNLRVVDIGRDGSPTYFDHHLQSSKATSDKSTTWEIAMNVYTEDYEFGSTPRKLKAGEDIGFMVAYCDNDNSPEREHFVGSIAIEGEDKNRGWIDAGVFNNWTLVE